MTPNLEDNIISLTVGVDYEKGLYHILEANFSKTDKTVFEESIIIENYDKKRFKTMQMIYKHCRAQQACWDVKDHPKTQREKLNSFYNKYEYDILADGWGQLADYLQSKFETTECWTGIYPQSQKY